MKENFNWRVNEDKYGKTVCELSLNGENLQELLVKEGHSEIYKKLSKPCELAFEIKWILFIWENYEFQ